MASLASLGYGVVVYMMFMATFVYTILFTANLLAPKTIDSGSAPSVAHALAVDLALLAVFALQHSLMARRSFKRWWTQWVSPAVERSTFVLAATLALALLLWQWRPIPALVWNVTQPAAILAIDVVFWLGWVVLFVSTCLINHFELFGLAQVVAKAAGRELPAPEFRTPLLYRYVRHPLYFGFLLTFWAVPVMTAGHLLFSAGATGYILVGVWFEERDLIAQFGDRYRAYRDQVGMLLPWRKAPVAVSGERRGGM